MIDATNAFGVALEELDGLPSSVVISRSLAGARLVKAFNHLPAKLLADEPRAHGGRRVLFLAGADGAAKTDVSALIGQLGFFGVDLGQINEGGRAINVPGGGLTVQNLIRLD